MSEGGGRFDTGAINAEADLVALVSAHVKLKQQGREWHGCCPFHDERTPSFTVAPDKGFFHCFGCGAHGNAIGWMMDFHRLDFVQACEELKGERQHSHDGNRPVVVKRKVSDAPRQPLWLPIRVADDAPVLVGEDGMTVPIWNPKPNERYPVGRFVQYQPVRADAYRDEAGRLLGYVLRLEFKDRKITPTITWCVGPDGVQQWCVRPFRDPRPLCGLDALAGKPDAPVLVPEGEKCRAAGAGALPQYAVVTWPGGSKGIGHVDWSPMRGRDVVLWPDADQAGRDAMLGWTDRSGMLHRGVAQHVHRAGAKSIRMVDPAGMPKGWDMADALGGEDPWSPRQLAAWAASRVVMLDIETDPRRSAR